MEKLLKPFTGTGTIFFPIGKPPRGTCEFSTAQCRKHCYVKKTSLFDWESTLTDDIRRDTYNFIIKEDIQKVCRKIREDLAGLQTKIVTWFGSGDCEAKHLDKISGIIKALRHSDNVIQMGFTRNEELWNRFPDIFALSIESVEAVNDRKGMFSIANYEAQVSVMHSPDYQVRGGHCGPVTCGDMTDMSLEHHLNCQICHKLKVGCFDRRA